MAAPMGPGVRAVLAEAEAARSAGKLPVDRAGLVRAFDAARAGGDAEGMAQAALGMVAGRGFGTDPGRAPAFLHEAYDAAHGASRTRLAIALARAWAYGGDPERAAPFAARAVDEAEAAGDESLLADALDAALLTHWGPDELLDRLRITDRLTDVVAHVSDEDARLTAHLWGLTTALECLDGRLVRRHVRAIELLAAESERPRTRFFARSRTAMLALLNGDDAAADKLLPDIIEAGTAAAEPDTDAVAHTLRSELARQRGDLETLRAEARMYEEFGLRESVPAVVAEAALLWSEVGQPDRAAGLVRTVAGDGLATVARDVDWLLTVTTVTRSAAGCRMDDVTAEGVELLTPYAGRGVVNAGAVMFAGVVDDHLAHALASLGAVESAAPWSAQAARAYERLGAQWWRARLASPPARSDTAALRGVLRPETGGVWTVGLGGSATLLAPMKGFAYLRLLLAAPGNGFGAQELSDVVNGHPGSGVYDHGGEELLDRTALAAYRRRLAELDVELEEGTAWGDEGRRARAQAERDALLDQLRTATGLGARTRRAPAAAERARVAVRKAITAALDRIASVDAPLGRLLADCIETGAVCRYRPDPARPVDWVTG